MTVFLARCDAEIAYCMGFFGTFNLVTEDSFHVWDGHIRH